MALVDTQKKLDALVETLSASKCLMVDTEFMRERTFYPDLCLIQVANDTDAWAIDPKADGLDLAPFLNLMNDPSILKVFHAARQDLEIFYYLTGQVPAPIFDTQIAAMVCGFGDSVGYQQLVAHFTGAQIDKSARFTDWSARPLRDSQITYALGDVIYLRDVYEALSDALEAKKRTNWIAEDMAALTDPESYDQPPELAWKRIKGRLRGAERLGRLRALAAWRDEFAKRKNRPRGRILRDEVLVGLAQSPPNSLESLAKFRGIDAGFARSMAGQELLEALKSSTPFSATELAALEKRGNKKASHEPALSLLKLVLKITAQEHDVAPKVIVGSRELEQFLEDPEAVQSVTTGWRAEVFGSRALAFLRGELAISYENGDVRIADIAQPAMAKSDDQRSEIA